jgi:hypothetical protein
MQHSTFQVLSEADLVLEFVTVCMWHPRSVLGCRLDDDLEHFVSHQIDDYFLSTETSAFLYYVFSRKIQKVLCHKFVNVSVSGDGEEMLNHFYVTCVVQKPETNMVFFSVNTTSAHAASMLAVADMMAFGAINPSAELDVNESLWPATTAQSLSSPYQAMKVLMAFACQGSHILSTIIQQL